MDDDWGYPHFYLTMVIIILRLPQLSSSQAKGRLCIRLHRQQRLGQQVLGRRKAGGIRLTPRKKAVETGDAMKNCGF